MLDSGINLGRVGRGRRGSKTEIHFILESNLDPMDAFHMVIV